MQYDKGMQKNKSLFLSLALLGIVGMAIAFGIPVEKPRPHEEVITEFTKLCYASNVHYRTKWLGVPSLQNPCDMWVLQEIVSEIKPDFIVETGTFKGGGPMEAVREFLKKHRNFAPDRTREKFLLTFFPQGYLKRLS